MENNPYSTPESTVASSSEPGVFHPPRRVPAGNGVQWISDGFKHFKDDAGNWIVICIVGFLILILMNVIPLVNTLAQVTAPVWTAGLMLGCMAQDKGEGLSINHLFAGFSNKLGPLLALGVIIALSSLVILAIIVGVVLGTSGLNFITGDSSQLMSAEFGTTMLLAVLVFMAAIIPIIAMSWFAPALIVLNDVPLFAAMGHSFKACFLNFVPFLPYGLVLTLLFFVGMIPLFLGLLVVMPIFYGSLYRSYKDIFID